MSDNLLIKKFSLLGFLVSIIFGVSFVFAANPTTFFSPTSNILDPGASNTPWGGCGPSDANCYIAKKILPAANQPSTGIIIKSPPTQTVQTVVVSNTITNKMLVTALRSLVTSGLPSDLLAKFQGPVGPQGVAGSSNNPNTSSFVTQSFLNGQVNSIFNSTSRSIQNLAASLSDAVNTKLLTVSGNTTVGGNLAISGQGIFNYAPTLPHLFTTWPSGTSNVSDAALYINPSTAVADSNLLGLAVNGVPKFIVDAEGDVYAKNIILTGSVSSASTSIAGNLSVQDNTTLGDAGTDMVEIKANTFTFSGSAPVIDATAATLSLNTTTNKPINVGTGLVTIPNLSTTFINGGTLGTAAFTNSTAYDVAGAAAAVTPTSLGLVIGTNVLAQRTFGTAANNNTGDFVAYRTFGTAASNNTGDFVAYRTFGTAANSATTDFLGIHGTADAVTGLSVTSGKTLTVQDNVTITGALGTGAYATIANYLPLAGGTMTGDILGAVSLGATGTRLTKVWTAALESTALPTINGGTLATALNLSGTNSGDNAANSTYTIGSQTQAYNANLTAINQALTTTSSPSFTAVGATTFTGALSGNATTATNAATVTNGVYTNAANSMTLPNPLTTIAESWIGPSSTTGIYFKGNNVGIGTTTPTAILNIKAGSDIANGAPLKLTSGALTTGANITAGSIEFNTDAFYGTTTTGPTRKTFAFLESPSFTTPTLGAATATTINGLTITANGTNTLNITAGKALTVQDNVTISGALGTGAYATIANYLPLAGGTLTGNLLFSTDNTLDIGASGATRPRTGYFGTSIIDPLVVGGTTTTSTLALRSTSGAGTSGADIIFQTGNNGATEAMRILNSGYVGIGATTPARKLDVLDANDVAQIRLTQTATSVYSELQSNSVGDLVVSTTGGNMRIQDGNLWVCSGGSCAPSNPAEHGNIIVETSIILDNGFRLKQTGSTTVDMLDSGANVILEFDQAQ